MHEYRRFVQDGLDARGWRQADLVRRSGLSKQLVSNILKDSRPALGQMPDESTLHGLATGFGVPVETVRTAASRALAGYTDDGHPLAVELGDVSTDALLNEVRRRIEAAEEHTDGTAAGTHITEPGQETRSTQHGRAGETTREGPMNPVRRLHPEGQAPDDPTAPPADIVDADAARAGYSDADRRRQHEAENEGDE